MVNVGLQCTSILLDIFSYSWYSLRASIRFMFSVWQAEVEKSQTTHRGVERMSSLRKEFIEDKETHTCNRHIEGKKTLCNAERGFRDPKRFIFFGELGFSSPKLMLIHWKKVLFAHNCDACPEQALNLFSLSTSRVHYWLARKAFRIFVLCCRSFLSSQHMEICHFY